MTVLRRGLLEGRAVALAGIGDGALGDALAGLGARIETVPELDGYDEERVGEWARSRSPLHALVYCADADTLDGAWVAVREVAVGALIPAGTGGKIVLVAPPNQAMTQAGLENLARTLSVEWARHGVTLVAVAPGPHAGPADLAEVVCYLVSVAGDYISGTRLDLGLAL